MTRPLAAVALVAAATAAVGLRAGPVSAAPATFTEFPTRLYMIPAENSGVVPDALAGLFIPVDHMMFDDVPVTGDVISRQSRIIEISAEETAACRHHGTDGTNATPDPADDFDLTGCTAVQLAVNPTEGTIRFDPDPVAEDDPRHPDSDPQIQLYRFASGAILRDVDDPQFFEGGALALIGTASEINETLKTLVFTPTVDDPSTEEVDEDYYYTGIPGEGEMTVDLVPGDQTEGGSVTREVQIRVLDYNDFPEVEVPQDQWTIADPNTGADFPLFSPDDGNPPANPSLVVADEDNDEVIDQAQDGDDPDSDPGDGDDPDDGAGDEFLVIAWATCGKFSLISSNGFEWDDDLEHVFDYVADQFGDPLASDPANREMLEEALRLVIPDDVEQLPFANVNPTSPTDVLVAVADDIESVNYNLGRITFHPVDDASNPLQNTTCKVRALISDLGNNGLPLQYLGEPDFGLEIPFFGVDLDTNYVPAVEEMTITIGDGGETIPTLTAVSDVALAEGDAGATSFTFTLSLDEPASGDETVDVVATHTGPTPNTDDTDFVPPAPQTVTFADGAQSASVTILVDGDTDIEPDEHFQLVLSNPQNLTLGDSSGLGTVQNDDPDPGVQVTSFTGVTLPEGDAGSTAFAFEIGLSDPAPPGGVSVRVNTVHGTTDGADLTPVVNQTVVFPEGEDTRTVTVNVAGDTDVEPTETFVAALSNPIGASIAAGAEAATGTIITDDHRTVSIGDVTLAEGDAGTTAFTFTLTLDGPAVGGESVQVSTGGGGATAGVDYTALNDELVTFAPGTSTSTVTVNVAGDTTFEPDDLFLASLNTPVNLIIGDGTGEGTILNDDDPVVTIGDVTMAEGDAGDTQFVFTLTLEGPAPAGASVDVTPTPGSADGTDFDVAPTTTVPFVTGSQSATFTVVVSGDPDVELDEAFTVELSNPVNLQLGPDTTGTGTIQNDDGPVDAEMVTIGDVSQPEGDVGTTPFVFTLDLNGAAEGTESVTATVTHITTDGVDLVLDTQVVPFVNGATQATFTVDVSGDTTPEPDDTFAVTLSAPVGVLIADNGATGTIENDDAVHITSIAPVQVAEGDAGTTNLVFVLDLDAPALGTESVVATRSNVSTDDGDFADAVVPVVFTAGQMTATATVHVMGDTTEELDETFTLSLSAPQNVVIDPPGTATGTILNDDGPSAPPQIVAVSDVSADEGDAGTTNFVFTLTLDQPAAGGESVQVSTSHGPALPMTNGADLAPLVAQPVTFAMGATTATVTVLVTGDTTVEGDEHFRLNLAAPQGVTIAAGAVNAEGTVLNDDAVVQPPDPLTITVPADITVLADLGQNGTVVSYPAPTTAGGVPPVTVTCNHPSGGFYTVGVTTVTCTATDSGPAQQQVQALATVSDTFTITVLANPGPDTTPPPGPTVPPPGTQPGGTLPNVGELPATGGDNRAPLGIAALTCAAGAILLLVRRRERLT